MFFEEFFKKRGENIEANSKHEVLVKCPFPHDKGTTENHASASFNTKKRIYKCFTCAAEDREQGMSETAFVAKVYNTTYDNAVKLKNMKMDGDTDNLASATELLLNNKNLKTYLNNRGITDEAIVRYKLGYTGDGILYPVILNGILFDRRIKNINPQEHEPPIMGRKHSTTLLFPYDEWLNDSRPTLLCGGENDTILARIMGFNAVESTGGEGGIPKILINKFKNKTVYIAYDCDKAGKQSSHRIAYYLKEAGAKDIYLVDLGLQGTKEDKDITDYFIKHKKTAADLQQLLDHAPAFTQEQYQEQKNKEYELVNLWNIKHSRYSDKYISSRVMQVGHYEFPQVDVPSHAEWECRGDIENSTVCASCPFNRKNNRGEWSLEDENLEDLLELVEINSREQIKGLRRVCGIPEKCPNSRITVVAKKHVEKVILAPDVETESEATGFKQAELHAFILNGDTEDGNRYRIYFKRVPHPRDQSIILIVDKVEESDNAINSFKVTPQFLHDMKKWQGDPFYIMRKRYEELGKVAVGKYLPSSIFYAADIVYHGLLDFKFMGKYIKGHPEGLIVGASRTGKSEVLNVLTTFYGLGNVTECKNASLVGLIGGVDKNSTGTFRINWGSIPRNHKGLLFMDEVSGLHPEVFKHLTGLRSQRKAVIEKIRKGVAPAKTRLLWVGNPRLGDDKRSRSLYDYSNGVQVCLDLFPTDEDVARFDFIVLVPEPEEYISPLNDDGSLPEEQQLPEELRQLIRWVWSRNKDQVVFEPYVEKYIEHVALELNKDFGSTVKIIGVEGVKKIARMAASVASCCFSCDGTGELVVVKKEHVDWVKAFLLDCYDNSIFRLKQYVKEERKFSTTTAEINMQVAATAKRHPMIIKLLLEQSECPTYNLKAASGIPDDEFRNVTSKMFELGLIQPTQKGWSATRRLRLATDEIRKNVSSKKQTDPDKPRSFSDKLNLK